MCREATSLSATVTACGKLIKTNPLYKSQALLCAVLQMFLICRKPQIATLTPGLMGSKIYTPYALMCLPMNDGRVDNGAAVQSDIGATPVGQTSLSFDHRMVTGSTSGSTTAEQFSSRDRPWIPRTLPDGIVLTSGGSGKDQGKESNNRGSTSIARSGGGGSGGRKRNWQSGQSKLVELSRKMWH